MSDAKRSLAAIAGVALVVVVVWIATRGGDAATATSTASTTTTSIATTTTTSIATTTTTAPSATVSPSASASARLAPAPVYVAAQDGFEITFPSLAAPTIDRGAQETPKGNVPVVTYYVTYGASAFSVSVARHAHAHVVASTPAALARATRDDIVARTGAKIVGDRPFEITSADGKKHPGLYQELALPRGLRSLYAIAFVCDVAYTLSAAGPAGDPSLDAGLFAGFVASLKVTKTFGCERGG